MVWRRGAQLIRQAKRFTWTPNRGDGKTRSPYTIKPSKNAVSSAYASKAPSPLGGLTVSRPGTEGSNPPPSSAESCANPDFRICRLDRDADHAREPAGVSRQLQLGCGVGPDRPVARSPLAIASCRACPPRSVSIRQQKQRRIFLANALTNKVEVAADEVGNREDREREAFRAEIALRGARSLCGACAAISNNRSSRTRSDSRGRIRNGQGNSCHRSRPTPRSPILLIRPW
jgi:hypothetical protein